MTTSLLRLSASQESAIHDATQSIAPNWPLDQMIAVNPLWQRIQKSFDQVASELSTLAGIQCYMSLSEYQTWFAEGRISQTNLVQAAQEYQLTLPWSALERYLNTAEPSPKSWRNVADWADLQRDNHKMSWHDEITHQISQFCAAHYQQQRPMLQRQYRQQSLNLYQHWLDVTRTDQGLSIILSEATLGQEFEHLPNDPEQLFAEALTTLQLSSSTLGAYLQALLLDINGWGAYLSYRQFEASKQGKQLDDLRALLAIKLAWELVIWRYLKRTSVEAFEALMQRWGEQILNFSELKSQHDQALLAKRIWARALELTEQSQLQSKLKTPPLRAPETPVLQAIFCIDVRSEIYRRALERQSRQIETFGFAGFFGLPIEYQQAGTQVVRPQLPGLVTPSIRVFESQTNEERLIEAQRSASWNRWGQAASSTFSMVESMGWWYAFKLFKNSLSPIPSKLAAPIVHSHWTLTRQGHTLDTQEQAQLAKSVLDAMGIQRFANTVLLVGHGSHTCNNLQSAGLECGACGGQSGEVNVKVLAQLLNNNKVREALKDMGHAIPSQTQFVPALHNTVTDHITCFNKVNAANVQDWLQQATYHTQQERAVRLDAALLNMDKQERNQAYLKRAKDWSQTRPEWGLADNHSFLIAPRHCTRHLDLQGRSFLHDYDEALDPEGELLERLMTAPMLVTHWINMQYNLSTTDNFKFGSGNKVLHNAVGEHIGLFEGNGGDLRIGLAMQSLHDGKQWMHTPQRLGVYIRASRENIAKIVNKHEVLRHLVNHQWLYLYRWKEAEIEQFIQGEWLAV